MGKGARNRAKRKKAAEEQQSNGLTEALLEELFAVEDPSGFAELLARRPELWGDQVEDQLHELAAVDGYGATFGHLAELLAGARTNLDHAWAKYERARRNADDLARQLERETSEIEAAAERREFDEVIALTDSAIPKANEAGLGMLACQLHSQRGLAFLQSTSVDRAQDLEAAIEAHEAALALAVPGEQTANLLMHLALVYGERVRGDRAENLERAVGLLRAALDQLDPARIPELEAMLRTNLAVALMRSERGDRVANLREAAQLCQAALEYRSPERDAGDWAYSQLNLGEVLEDLAALGEGDVAQARRAYERVIEQEQHVRERWLVGGAHHALGRFHLRAAQVSAEDIVDAEEAGLDRLLDNTPLLEAARDHLQMARELMRTGPDPLRHARVLDDLSNALAQLNADDEAIAVAREALTVLRPTSAPRACTNVGGRLGNLLSERGQWDEAAAAFRDAVEAAEFSFHARLDTESREQEARQAGNLSRWAAFAIARSGDAVGAALVLENGRARELRRRLGLQAVEEARLAELPAGLGDAYVAAVENLVASPMGATGATAARWLQEVLAAIREIPGFEDFSTGARPEDLAAALEPGWPLVYVNPTPNGTLLLRLSLAGADVSVEPMFLDSPRSIDVFMRLIVGDAAALPDRAEVEESSSYLLGISGEGEGDRDFKVDLERVLPWLGNTIAKPVRDLLAAVGASGATLVSCGPVGVAPLHVASWHEQDHDRCLLDDFDIRYAPSAVLCAASLRRAASRRTAEPSLVAVADPTGDLPAARPEVEEIARRFGDGRRECAFGHAADRRFLQSRARTATHLHLACHASGGLFDADASVFLANGPLSALDLTALGPLQTRLVAISACQSALSEIAGLPDEVFSIGTAMLAAGSACAIASLWPVHDLATALLMTRLYEEIFQHDHRPPEALRRAQLWLRDLTTDREGAFLAEHPALGAEFRRRAAYNDRPGLRRSSAAVSNGARPYSHPDYWAAFIAVGA